MAGLITVRLSRNDSQPWGFRLQGGKDFGAPLLIQKVNGGSLAEKAGLQVADAVIKVNGQDVYNLRHKDAQDVIVKAGSSFEVVVSRGPGGTWRPAVTPVGNLPSPSPVGGGPAAVTKTSLAYQGTPSPAFGSGHNVSAKPFGGPQLNGDGVSNVKSIASKQYNSPVGLYSDQNIAETLSAQAEVLAGGVLGVNFMKNEKAYNANNSEVLKMVQEIDSEPREPEPDVVTPGAGSGVVMPPPLALGLRHVAAPENKPPNTSGPQSPAALQPGQNICGDCERLIVGVFVRIKDKNLHVECFKCATCGTSLKNVGYFNINNKLYCDVHAKLVARANPPAPDLDPVTIPPGGRIPAGVVSAPLPTGAPQSPQPGTLAPLPFHAPRMKPSHVSAPRSFKAPSSSLPSAKPYAPAAPAPLSSVPFSSTPVAPPTATVPFSSAPVPPSMPSFPKINPGQTDPSFATSSSQTHKTKEQDKETEAMAYSKDVSKRMSVSSNEVCALSENKSAVRTMSALMEDPQRASPIPFNKNNVVSEDFKSIAQETVKKSENVQKSEEGNVQITRKTKVEESFVRSQKMYTAEVSTSSQSAVQMRAASPEMEQIMARKQVYQSYQDTGRLTPSKLSAPPRTHPERCLTPEIELLMDKPHGTWSPMPPACQVRTLSPGQIISFPPEAPVAPTAVHYQRTATPEQFQEARETVERFVDHSKHSQQQSAQQTLYSQTQQYVPRYDATQGFSAYQGNGSGNPGNSSNGQSKISGGTVGNGTSGKESSGNVNHKYNGKEENNTRTDSEEKPTVTEPDDDYAEKQSRKSSKTGQSQKSSASEEECSRRVFSDFGGPQISTSVEVESTTEGGVEKTSVKKSEKMQYSSCEFESKRKTLVTQKGEITDSASDESGKTETAESKPRFPAGETSENEEEMVTKSQVEEIIKQELNKVFQMAQTMEKTNFGEMYDQKLSEQKLDQKPLQVPETSSSKHFSQKLTSTNDKVLLSGEVITKTGKLTSGLTIAPDRSFTPQALESSYPLPYQNLPTDFPPPRSLQPEPASCKPGYIPVTGIDRSSPLLQALTIASDRPYSPLPIPPVAETPSFITQTKQSSMLEALTTAPSTPFQIKTVESEVKVGESKTTLISSDKNYESVQKYAPKPAQSDFKPILSSKTKPGSTCVTAAQTSEMCNISSFPPITNELKSTFKGSSTMKTSSFTATEINQAETSKQAVKFSHQGSLAATKSERPITPSGLHPPNLLPYYQQNIGEIPLAHRSNSPVPHQIKAPSITPSREQLPSRERRGSVKAMSEAYTQQIAAVNNQHQQQSSVSYLSAGAFSSGGVTKTYSYEQEHKSIDPMGYHASPLAGKLPFAGEQTLPKCSSPLLGKLDHTKQLYKPSISTQPSSAFQSATAEQANLRQAPPYFVQDKEKSPAPWTVVKEKKEEDVVNISNKSFQQSPVKPPAFIPTTKPVLPSLPSVNKTPSIPAPPNAGPGGAKSGATAGTSAPRRGRGVLNTAGSAGGRVPLCASCNGHIRGPFITALGKIWCPDHFVCVNANCRRPLQDIGFVEDAQGLYCEYCFEQYLAPACSKCNAKVKGDCLNAIGKHFHPECFTCAYCGKLFGNSPFFLEDALPYCEADWNELFTTKCFSCGFPIEAGDRWVEALNNNYHSQCFNCTMCKKNLEGQSFFAKGGRPFCKNHAR